MSYYSNDVCDWCLLSQGTSIPNMNSIQLETKQLLRFHSSCHGNYVCMAMSNVVFACPLKEPPCQIQTQYNLKPASYCGYTSVAMATKLIQQQSMCWCLLSQRTSIPNMNSVRLKTKDLLTFHSGCHGSWVTIEARYVLMLIVPKNLHTKYELNTA